MSRQPKTLLTLFLFVMALASWPVLADESEDDSAEESAPAVTDYIALTPAFVTHVGEPGPKITYLKAAISLRASSTDVRPAVEAHMPRLRHELVMLFGEQTDANALTTMEGQQALREEAKTRINQILEQQQTGAAIDGVLFTEFVVQK